MSPRPEDYDNNGYPAGTKMPEQSIVEHHHHHDGNGNGERALLGKIILAIAGVAISMLLGMVAWQLQTLVQKVDGLTTKVAVLETLVKKEDR